MVKGYPGVDPLCVVLGQAGHHVRHDLSTYSLAGNRVTTLDKFIYCKMRFKPVGTGKNQFGQA